MRVAAVLGVLTTLALLPFLSGCGNSSSPDPFLGTWTETGSPLPIIIAKPGADYRVTTFQGTWPHADRDGHVLHLWAGAKPTPGYEFYLTYQPGSGELLFTDPEGLGVHILYRKTSDSTAVPSPFPLPSSTATASP